MAKKQPLWHHTVKVIIAKFYFSTITQYEIHIARSSNLSLTKLEIDGYITFTNFYYFYDILIKN